MISSLVRSRQAVAAAAPASELTRISLDDIDPSPYQPPGRSSPSDDDVRPLANSLALDGQLENIVIRRKGQRYELIAGERRWRAFLLNRREVAPDKRAQWETIKADVRDVSDAEAATLLAIENLQRENL